MRLASCHSHTAGVLILTACIQNTSHLFSLTTLSLSCRAFGESANLSLLCLNRLSLTDNTWRRTSLAVHFKQGDVQPYIKYLANSIKCNANVEKAESERLNQV